MVVSLGIFIDLGTTITIKITVPGVKDSFGRQEARLHVHIQSKSVGREVKIVPIAF